MSYDLMVFDKEKAPNFYENFLDWMFKQTQWEENRDYNSTAGISPKLVSWFMEVKEIFPPLNGEYSLSDEEAFTSADIEIHLTDYSIGSDFIYSSIGWSVAEEADRLMLELSQKHDLGLYNPQTGEVHSDSMILCKMRTESCDDQIAIWEHIEKEIQSLDAPARGTTQRSGAFVTLFFEQNGMDDEFMQCIPVYPKQQGFFKKLFGADDNAPITEYIVEVCTKGKIYEKQVLCKKDLSKIIYDYYKNRKPPDISDWLDTNII